MMESGGESLDESPFAKESTYNHPVWGQEKE